MLKLGRNQCCRAVFSEHQIRTGQANKTSPGLNQGSQSIHIKIPDTVQYLSVINGRRQSRNPVVNRRLQ